MCGGLRGGRSARLRESSKEEGVGAGDRPLRGQPGGEGTDAGGPSQARRKDRIRQQPGPAAAAGPCRRSERLLERG